MKMKTICYLLVLISACTARLCYANANNVVNAINDSKHRSSNFFNDSDNGWFWYQNPAKHIKKKKNKMKFMESIDPDLHPLQALRQYKLRFKRAEARAILDPTQANIIAFMHLNRRNLYRASYFSDVARRVVWQTPSLDYSIRRPTAQAANFVYKDNREKRILKAIKNINQTYGLFFFFKKDCQYCNIFAQTLLQLKSFTGVKIKAISLDGSTLPSFPNAVQDNGISKRLVITSTPSLLLIDPRKGRVIPVANTYVSIDDLEKRIYILTQTKPGQDY